MHFIDYEEELELEYRRTHEFVLLAVKGINDCYSTFSGPAFGSYNVRVLLLVDYLNSPQLC